MQRNARRRWQGWRVLRRCRWPANCFRSRGCQISCVGAGHEALYVVGGSWHGTSDQRRGH
jgi:hypothetical protein